MPLLPDVPSDTGRTKGGLQEFGCLPLAAVIPGMALLGMFVLGWMGYGYAAVVVGVIGAIAAVPTGYFASLVLRKSWGAPPATWVALGAISWLILVGVLVFVLLLRR